MDKPRNIVIAANLLWISLALGIVYALGLGFSFLRELNPHHVEVGPLIGSLTAVISFGVLAFLIFKISAGRRWALITFSVLFALGTPGYIAILLDVAKDPIYSTVYLSQFVLQGYALFLMFTKPGRTYFQRSAPQS